MSLRFAILTALSEKSSTGIELARRFDKSIGYFWPASHQQIYRELDKLVGDALIEEVTGAAPPARGNPRTFAVTTAGTTALREWTETLEDPRKNRDPLMVRLRAAAALGDVDVRPALEDQLDAHRAKLAEYEAIEARQFTGELDRAAQIQRAILQAGIATERMWIDWLTETAETL